MAANIKIEGIINKTISYSMQQNRIQAIKTIRIVNQSDKEWSGLKLRVRFQPEFAETMELPVLNLSSYAKVEIKNPVPVMKSDYMISLTEKETGTITMELFDGEELLCSHVEEISVLPYGQWSGMVYMPELLCAFVMPNHPSVTGLTAAAAKWLEKWKGDPSLLGYTTQNPNDVKTQVAAVYEALKQENIAYSLPPASYESVGQKVRTPDEILGQKLGTCLDLTLLYASVLEAMRLHPILILLKDHAYVGCWLEEKSFAECIQEDITALLKRTAEGIDELLLVECTALVAGKNLSFEDACKAAKNTLVNEADFRMAIDVSRCRGSNILPLPARVLENGSYKVVEYKGSVQEADAPKALSNAGRGAKVEENTMTKQKLWERKLLDLSLRNTLLNFRVTKNCVQLIVNDPALLEDALSKGDDFAVFPIPQESGISPGQDKIYVVSESEDLMTTAVSEFKNKRIRTFLPEEQLAVSMKYLQRQAKHSLEENGSNTLYLALGFLKWYETDVSKKERYAPLILLPVDLTKRLQDKSYHIKIRDEEAQINVTLLEFLRQDFGMDIGGLDPLPADENGLDIPLILNTVRQSIMEKAHWDVLPYAFLGIFSFSRFIMWNDIRNRSEDILSNKVVASLISGKMEWEPKPAIDAHESDKRVKPNDMAVVMSADASQMVAIETAAKGESFVLHGPPGTGKSQTITNMIANALYQGKSVLFVAEKMAALSVVQKRLEKVGLAPFCLELHSNKAQKQAVLNQLDRSLQAAGAKSSEDYEKQAERLYKLRCELNDVVEALHRKTETGFSVYELVGSYENTKEFENRLCISEEMASKINAESYQEIKDTLSELAVVGKECGNICDHPLRAFRLKEYSMELRNEWEKLLDDYTVLLGDLKTPLQSILQQMGYTGSVSVNDLLRLEQVLRAILHVEDLSAPLLAQNNAVSQESYIRGRIQAGIDYRNMRNEMLTHFKPGILTYGVDQASNRLVAAQGKWFLAKNSEIKALIKELRFLAINPNMVQEQNLEQLYERIRLYHTAEANMGVNVFFENAFAGIYHKEETDWEALKAFYEKHLALCKMLEEGSGTPALESKIKEMFATGVYSAFYTDKRSVAETFLAKRQECLAVENRLITGFGLEWNEFVRESDFIPAMEESIALWKGAKEELRSYAAYCHSEKKLEAFGLTEVGESYRFGELKEEEFLPAFICNFAKAAAGNIIGKNPVLSGFNGAGFTAAIENFCEVSDRFEMLTRQEVVARLSARIPKAGEGFAQSSELGILQKAIKSQRRAMPIRKLFNQIPTLLRRMCPCMLMSPISVAQYIDPSFPKFDLVIFDEASQLPTGEAVGALARGTDVIVVGDPKQLPPTSFFMTNQQNEETTEVEDMESLLDDCLALSMPQSHLLWHYRSRHESLIAYSNMTYYDNKLYTFPSPNDLISEVKWVPVEGFYDRGKTKQNRAEAEAVVAEIMRRLADEELRKSSIGVVTFSAVQQELIDDLLQEALHKQPEFEQYAVNVEEPVFIKNLENVQGDERDVILFSIGYGPDEKNHVGLNFGPLNQDGGWRRLNVAISRSRKQMMIFSTLRPEQLDLSRTSAEGVIGLKGFLEFAARGKNAFYRNADSMKVRNSDVARAVVKRLQEGGYQANLDIGTSEYKVDIGVIDPQNPEQYCLGILLDGENYMAASTARDRNLLQPSVLKGLGWNIYRIWTLDWLDTPEREFAKLEDAIQKALHPELFQDENTETVAGAEGGEELQGCIQDVAEETPAEKEKVNPNRKEYVHAELPLLGDMEDFYQPKTKLQIMKAMEKVLTAEAPVEYGLFKKKVAACWGMSRTSPKVDALFEEVLREIPVTRTNTAGNTFLWLDNMDPVNYHIYRVHEDGDAEKRSMAQIPAEELVNGVKEVTDKNISLTREDLIKETGKLFGFRRVTAEMDQAVGIAISYAEQRGYVEISEDGMKVTQKQG